MGLIFSKFEASEQRCYITANGDRVKHLTSDRPFSTGHEDIERGGLGNNRL